MIRVLTNIDIVCGLDVLDRAIEHIKDDQYLKEDLIWLRDLIAKKTPPILTP